MISVEEYYTEIYVSVTLIQGQKLVIIGTLLTF